METAGLFAGPALGSLFVRAGDAIPGLLKALRDDKELAPPPPNETVTPGNTYGANGNPSGGNVVGTLVDTLI